MIAEIALHFSILCGAIKHGFFHIFLSYSTDRTHPEESAAGPEELKWGRGSFGDELSLRLRIIFLALRTSVMTYEMDLGTLLAVQDTFFPKTNNFFPYNRNLPKLSIEIFREGFLES